MYLELDNKRIDFKLVSYYSKRMLIFESQILNDNTDEDSEDARRNSAGSRGVSHKSVLSQLLQPGNNGSSNNGRADSVENSYVEKMMKRKFDDDNHMPPSNKRPTPENQQVSSLYSIINYFMSIFNHYAIICLVDSKKENPVATNAFIHIF